MPGDQSRWLTAACVLTEHELWKADMKMKVMCEWIESDLYDLVPHARRAELQVNENRRGSRGVTFAHASGLVVRSRLLLEQMMCRNGKSWGPGRAFGQLVEEDVALDLARKHWVHWVRDIWRRLSARLNIEQSCAVREGMSGAELLEVYSEANGDWQWLVEYLEHLLPAAGGLPSGRAWVPSHQQACCGAALWHVITGMGSAILSHQVIILWCSAAAWCSSMDELLPQLSAAAGVMFSRACAAS
jgi:hypothetical protein